MELEAQHGLDGPGYASPPRRTGQRVALVHDFLLDLRGGERTFSELCAMWPEADLFTVIYDEEGTEGRFAGRRIHTSFLQKLRPTAGSFRVLLPLYPAAVESLDVSGYDLIISSSSAWAHGVLPGPAATHVSYCHNPFRYAWSEREQTLERRSPPVRLVLAGVLEAWRKWDRNAATRTHRYIANARITQQRLREYFDRESAIVYPPVETKRFGVGPVGEHYAVVSELMAHKQLDIAIEAFNRIRRPLTIVGDGPDFRRLRRLAGPNVTFMGRLSDEGVAEVMSSARALIVSAVEEFGITAVEAQAAGRPVIGRAEGGLLETVLDGVTGRLWSGGPEELAASVRNFDDSAIDPRACVANAGRFSAERFRQEMTAEVSAALWRRTTNDARL